MYFGGLDGMTSWSKAIVDSLMWAAGDFFLVLRKESSGLYFVQAGVWLTNGLYLSPKFIVWVMSEPKGVKWLSWCPGEGVMSGPLLYGEVSVWMMADLLFGKV